MMKKTYITLLILISSTFLGSSLSQELKAGDTAPTFKLKNVDGKYYSFDSFPEAKGFVVIFTCNSCPFSVAYEDRIIDLHNKFSPLGYPVIAINPNDPDVQPKDSFEKMKVRAKEKNFPFVYLFDEGQKIYPQYGANRTPHVFLVDKKGEKNIIKYVGAIDNNFSKPEKVDKPYVSDAIHALIKGERLALTHTKAIGCTIKKK